MSRKSVLSRHANSLVEPELPLRAYFLSVGGALLLLLLAVDWVLPAPLPSRLTDSHSALPPIRIHSDLKGPEAVVIDTTGFGLRPTTAAHDIADAASQPPESGVADATMRASRRQAASTDQRVRESLAQLRPTAPHQASESAGPRDDALREPKINQASLLKRRRPAGMRLTNQPW